MQDSPGGEGGAILAGCGGKKGGRRPDAIFRGAYLAAIDWASFIKGAGGRLQPSRKWRRESRASSYIVWKRTDA